MPMDARPTRTPLARALRCAAMLVVVGVLTLPLMTTPAGASFAHDSKEAIDAKAAEFDQAWKDQVVRLYAATFLRAPDAGGAAYWNDKYRSGVAHHAIATEFAASPEFRQRYGALDSDGFVRRLYRNVMGREGDAGGVAHWRAQLDAGKTRGWVLVGFSDSPEFVVKTGTVPPPALAPNPVPVRTTPVPTAPGARYEAVYDFPGERHWFQHHSDGDFERIVAHVDFHLASVTGWPAPVIQDWQGGSRSWRYDGGAMGILEIVVTPPRQPGYGVQVQIKRIE